jgi:hypothetical protein
MDHDKHVAGDLPEENLLPIGASTFRSKTKFVFDLSPSSADPFDSAMAITLVLPVMPTWWRKRLPPLTLSTPTTEMTHDAFTASGMRRSTTILRRLSGTGN